jgi:outer membrane protein assembly factor BamB
LVVLAAALVMLLSGCDWTMFGFDAARSRFSPDTTVSTSNVAKLVLQWSAVTGGQVASSPAVADGIVYVGSTTGTIFAFKASTGATSWRAATGGAIYSSPAVMNGVVYIGSDDHNLYAFDANGAKNCSATPKTCTPLWTAHTRGAVRSSPAVVNGVVYIGSDDHNLWVFDANGTKNCSGTPRTCTRLWTAHTGGGIDSSPAVVNGVVYVGSGDANLYTFDANGTKNCSGTPTRCTPLWTASPGNVGMDASPAVANGVVYVGGVDYVGGGIIAFPVNYLVAFDANGSKNCSGAPKTCRPLWVSNSNIGTSDSSPSVANGVVYYLGAGAVDPSSAGLYGLDASGKNCSVSPTRCRLWDGTVPGNTNGSADSSPAVANGMIYVGANNGTLYAFGLP